MSLEEMKEETTAAPAVPAAPVDSPRKHLWGEETPKDSGIAQFLDDIYGVLFSPKATFEDLAARPPVGMALVLYALVLAVSGIASLPSLKQALTEVGVGGEYLASITGLITPFFIVFTVFSWIWGTAVLHLIAEWLGGRGRAADLFTLGAFYKVPQLFMAPLALLAAVTLPGLLNFFSFVVGIWIIVLQVIAIRANYRLSTGRAIAVVVIPVATVIAVSIVLIISAFALSVPFLPPDVMNSLGSGSLAK